MTSSRGAERAAAPTGAPAGLWVVGQHQSALQRRPTKTKSKTKAASTANEDYESSEGATQVAIPAEGQIKVVVPTAPAPKPLSKQHGVRTYRAVAPE